jgi:hypothetical protein
MVTTCIELVTGRRQSHPRCHLGPDRSVLSARVAEWKSKALELLPTLRPVIEHDWSCHVFLGELLPQLWDAHRAKDEDSLHRIYGFARWCFDQPGQFLTNAAVVSFYELVFDEWDLRHDIATWLPPDVVARVRPLWEWRLPGPKMAEVDRLVADNVNTPEPEVRDVS